MKVVENQWPPFDNAGLQPPHSNTATVTPIDKINEALQAPQGKSFFYPATLFSNLSKEELQVAEDLLIEAVERHQDVRAAMTLGAMGCKRAAAALRALSKDPREVVSRFGTLALAGSLGDRSILKVKGDGSAADLVAIGLAGDTWSQAGREVLFQGLQSTDSLARFSAADGLYKMMGWTEHQHLKDGEFSFICPLTVALNHVGCEMELLYEPARRMIEMWCVYSDFTESDEELGIHITWDETPEVREVIFAAGQQKKERRDGVEQMLEGLEEVVRRQLFETLLSQLSPEMRYVGAPATLLALADSESQRNTLDVVLQATLGAYSVKEQRSLNSRRERHRLRMEKKLLEDAQRHAFEAEVSRVLELLGTLQPPQQ